MNLTFPAKVYSMVLISVVESATEAFVSYGYLIWICGNYPLFLPSIDPSSMIDFLGNLQPLFDAIRKCFQLLQ
jgi:hypothetical protein